MMFEVQAGGAAYAQGESQSAAKMGSEVIHGQSTQSKAQKGSEVIATKEAAPELTTEQSEQLQKVLNSKRVELVMHTGSDSQAESGAVASVKLNETIQFKGVHHGDQPIAEFKDKSKALEILGDVATIMKLYNTAILLVEGHTATPPERMDQWAHDLAGNRAEKVKAALEDLGVDSTRLRSVGLPGNLGSGKVDTVLKITSF